jgi:hypothetical protein
MWNKAHNICNVQRMLALYRCCTHAKFTHCKHFSVLETKNPIQVFISRHTKYSPPPHKNTFTCNTPACDSNMLPRKDSAHISGIQITAIWIWQIVGIKSKWDGFQCTYSDYFLVYLQPMRHIRRCIQKFPDWPPGARTANDTTCGCVAILWVSLVSFAAITLYVAFQRVIVVVVAYFIIDSVRKLLDIPSYEGSWIGLCIPVIVVLKIIRCDSYRT